ncbi:hypothetical protein NKI89_08160 [Mesorhizobium sp. M0309]|uniref:hypothetical protein n=1 Tax=Mesorhizobium sp. M0309 TaxID=2956933 RepID=UPI00333E01C2
MAVFLGVSQPTPERLLLNGTLFLSKLVLAFCALRRNRPQMKTTRRMAGHLSPNVKASA